MGTNYYDRRNIYPDRVLVECYKKHGSQNPAALELGVSRETVARAVRRAGVPMTGRTRNGKVQPLSKINDAMLAEEAKTLTSKEIAIKYNMSEERVYRRAKKLGVNICTSWTGGHWRRRAERYGCVEFDSGISLSAVYARDRGICQICGKPTDPTDIKDGHIRRNYPTLDHVVPLSKGGKHTWDNVQLAHMACNSGKCDKEGKHGLG